MQTESCSKAVRVEGEAIVLHCWACGTAHCMNLELCAPEELIYAVCSNTSCRMSMFLVNELTADNAMNKPTMKSALGAPFAALSRFWR